MTYQSFKFLCERLLSIAENLESLKKSKQPNKISESIYYILKYLFYRSDECNTLLTVWVNSFFNEDYNEQEEKFFDKQFLEFVKRTFFHLRQLENALKDLKEPKEDNKRGDRQLKYILLLLRILALFFENSMLCAGVFVNSDEFHFLARYLISFEKYMLKDEKSPIAKNKAKIFEHICRLFLSLTEVQLNEDVDDDNANMNISFEEPLN
jgi:hypothetical protein